MARMFNPAHPGKVLREYLGALTVTEAAARLGVTRAALSRILNGSAGISADMALRLEAALGDVEIDFLKQGCKFRDRGVQAGCEGDCFVRRGRPDWLQGAGGIQAARHPRFQPFREQDFVRLAVFGIAFWLMTRIAPFSVKKEIEEDQNTALAVIMAGVLIGISLIIAAAVSGS